MSYETSTYGWYSCAIIAWSGRPIKTYSNDTIDIKPTLNDYKVYSILIEVLLSQSKILQVYSNEWTASIERLWRANSLYTKYIHRMPRAHLAERKSIAYFHITMNESCI